MSNKDGKVLRYTLNRKELNIDIKSLGSHYFRSCWLSFIRIQNIPQATCLQISFRLANFNSQSQRFNLLWFKYYPVLENKTLIYLMLVLLKISRVSLIKNQNMLLRNTISNKLDVFFFITGKLKIQVPVLSRAAKSLPSFNSTSREKNAHFAALATSPALKIGWIMVCKGFINKSTQKGKLLKFETRGNCRWHDNNNQVRRAIYNKGFDKLYSSLSVDLLFRVKLFYN